ncbi:MAG: U32 family peptidase [Clostridia bacterium]|nr:U32 family peptidase [Clostridia bacterium]
MNILVPLNDRSCVSEFSNAGADEFYIGFYDENWSRRFGEFADINRMSGFGKLANKYALSELKNIVSDVKNRGKKLYITLNANAYSRDALTYMEETYYPVFKSMNIDGLIVSDTVSASLAVKYGIPVTVSTMGGAYNRDVVKEYISIGAKRIIFPRDLSLTEIGSIMRTCPEVEYEVFHMRNGCVLSDSHCLGMHRPECGATCGYLRYKDEQVITDLHSFADDHDIELNDYLYNMLFHNEACAMCAVYRFAQLGISSLKIVGRADDTEGIIRDISLTAENIRIAYESQSEDEYLRNMRFHDNVPQKCRLAFSCYYPEVRF